MRRKSGRTTTEEELRLWRAAMRDAEPLARAQTAAPEKPAEPPEAAPRKPETPAARPDLLPLADFSALIGLGPMARAARPELSPARLLTSPPPAKPFVEPLGPSTPGLDRRTAQRLMKGDKRPEGRLDLHGLTLDRAHVALILFVIAARREGKRMVLVVTGKGGDYQARASGREGPRPGTLREATPRWLDSPQLKPHVGGVYPAHERHGGAGALYVYLRKG